MKDNKELIDSIKEDIEWGKDNKYWNRVPTFYRIKDLKYLLGLLEQEQRIKEIINQGNTAVKVYDDKGISERFTLKEWIDSLTPNQ